MKAFFRSSIPCPAAQSGWAAGHGERKQIVRQPPIRSANVGQNGLLTTIAWLAVCQDPAQGTHEKRHTHAVSQRDACLCVVLMIHGRLVVVRISAVDHSMLLYMESQSDKNYGARFFQKHDGAPRVATKSKGKNSEA